MRDNPIQFAVVREDPAAERAVFEAFAFRAARPVSRVLLGASGGCSALSLSVRAPETTFHLVDSNEAQLELVREKVRALASGAPRRRFNVADPDPSGLSQCGNFESLFRGFRELLFDLVAPESAFQALFRGGDADVERILSGRYWPVAFELFFADPLLEVMFGPDATQNAPPGSYPTYFRTHLERGLRAATRADNYFLHHVFLGSYLDRPEALPDFLAGDPPQPRLDYQLAGVEELGAEYASCDVVSLSNVFDWMRDEQVATVAAALQAHMKPGSALMYRQLNNQRDVRALLGDSFEYDDSLGESLLAAERSLFYAALTVAWRR